MRILEIYIFFIGFSLLVGIINYRWLKLSSLGPFVPFLAITFLTELVGMYTKYVLDRSNGILYNGYVFFQVVFCCLYFRTFKMPAIYQHIIGTAVVLYALAARFYYRYYGPPDEFSINLFLLGGFLVVLSGIFFLLNYFSADEQLAEKALEPVIWVTAALIAYFAVLSITVSMIDYIKYYQLEIGGQKLYNIMPRIMSIIMYTCFSYSFYRCRKLNMK